MPPLEARRSERVDYNAEVELLAGAAGAPHRVFAHAFDLGAGGMRVAGPLDMAVGDEVTCRVTLDGRPASLPGRVAWRREASSHESISANWLGICFQTLGAYESGLLRHVVERSSAGYRPVELHFAGVDQPVVARARTRANGLRISAALPIFSRDAELTFQLDEEGPLVTGRIGDATLREENGARRLEIEVDVVDDGVRFRRRARYGYPDEIEAEEHVAAEQARHASLADTQPNERLAPTLELPRPRARGRLWSSIALATVAGGALAWYAAIQLHADSFRENETDSEFVARPRATEDTFASALAPPLTTQPTAQPEPTPAPEPPTEPARAVEPETATAEAPAAPAPALAEVVPAQALEPPSAPAAQPPARPAAARSTATASEPLALTVPASEHIRVVPESSVEGDLTRIRIPFTGTLEKMRSVVWAEPAALAIDVPGASTSLEYGRFIVAGAGVTELRVNRSDLALLLRVRLSAPIARYTMTAENGTLEVLVQRASHATP